MAIVLFNSATNSQEVVGVFHGCHIFNTKLSRQAQIQIQESNAILPFSREEFSLFSEPHFACTLSMATKMPATVTREHCYGDKPLGSWDNSPL